MLLSFTNELELPRMALQKDRITNRDITSAEELVLLYGSWLTSQTIQISHRISEVTTN